VRSGGKAKIVGAAGYKEFNPKVYEQEYARQDVRAQVLMGLPADEVHLLHHYMPQDRFIQSNYYNEFFRQITEGYWSAATWITLDRGAGLGLGIGIHRSRRSDPEDSAQVEILSALEPAPATRRAPPHEAERRQDARQPACPTPSTISGSRRSSRPTEGRLVIANEAASRLFDPTRILGIDSSGKIVTCSAKATRELWEALEAAARPAPQAGAQQARDIIVNGNDQTPLLSLSVLPLHRRERRARAASATARS
jgi:hypothetical protein